MKNKLKRLPIISLWLTLNMMLMYGFIDYAKRLWFPHYELNSPSDAGNSVVWVVTVFPFLILAVILNLGYFVYVFLKRQYQVYTFELIAIILWIWAVLYRYDMMNQ